MEWAIRIRADAVRNGRGGFPWCSYVAVVAAGVWSVSSINDDVAVSRWFMLVVMVVE